ncbi:heterokaryon incompatibility protein-domain-containing protein [Xylariales sp. PMI_506]|nr:heterokaryon incompatibility protein-domain-containing protein [Xylariales sp. PMI_506]
MDTAAPTASAGIYVPLEDEPATAEQGGRPVPPERWGIRYLTLEPGTGDEPLRCQLIHSHLGSIGGRYEALSYTWGDTTARSSILLNGQPFQITNNLVTALQHLRRPQSGRTLWIDALCINQADVSEVNKYVRRMWAIYEKALSVVVFLGEAFRGSNQALNLLFQLSCLPTNLSHNSRHQQIAKLLRNSRKAVHWNSLRQLMQRPWWDRAWIIQEYAVARRVVFICGSARLGGNEFDQAMEYLLDFKYNATDPHKSLYLVRLIASTPISHLLTIRRRYQLSGADPNRGLLDILYRSRGSKATDPRDKVYSLFRLISEHPKLQPDYSRPVQDLYRCVVEAMIESSGTLEFLSHHNRGEVGVPGLPSWCPDWTVKHGKRLLLYTKEYSAAGNSRAQARVDGDTLIFKGRPLDRIKWLSKPFRSSDFTNSKKLHATIVDMKATVLEKASLANFPGGVDISKAFQETLVTSRILKREADGWKSCDLDSAALNAMWDALSQSLRQDDAQQDSERRKLVKTFKDAIHSALYGRAFFVSEQGHMGVVDPSAQVGDLVVVGLGGGVLFALHETNHDELAYDLMREERTMYHLIGECYMHGFMSGEGLPSTADESSLRDFHLI